ncbi:hypothetical protein AQ490_23175 [Wenjunlia vitaminophila]|uniref:Uncharacterized protein n=1 Tax=Wenjunlia vitaminophila TaxID=76728 RepID=A0A0T6LS04_WENVI|nr:hypothetical protein [Wenjunlia vitaminophila]KRV48776.1 hypothetical protein AQ490_23175 [Wenjunlia vitaminophila]
MPQYLRPVDLAEQVQRLTERVAQLERRSADTRAEMPMWPTGPRGVVNADETVFATQWEGMVQPRTRTLSIGLLLLGDQVAGVNTGGEWRLRVAEVVAATGVIVANFTWSLQGADLDLTPYMTTANVKIEFQTRRTSGATTGGKYGTGGCIASVIRYALLH